MEINPLPHGPRLPLAKINNKRLGKGKNKTKRLGKVALLR